MALLYHLQGTGVRAQGEQSAEVSGPELEHPEKPIPVDPGANGGFAVGRSNGEVSMGGLSPVGGELTRASRTVIPPAVRAVVFDAVGTLIHPEPPAAVVYSEVGRSFGSRLAAEEIADRFRRAFAQEEEIDRLAGLQTSEEREIRRWRQIVREVLDDVSDFESCFQQLFNHFSEGSAWRTEADAGQVLPELASRGYLLALASNYDPRLRRVAGGLEVLAPVKRLIISSEVGWRKPAAQFFAALSSAVALPPDQILYVGDDLTNDYDAARAAGLHAVLYDPRCAAPTSAARVARLTDLMAPPSHP